MSPLQGPDFCPRCGQTDVAGTDHSCRPVPAPPARLGIPERRVKPATVRITLSKWSRDFLFAASELLVAVEEADEALITDEVRAAAARLRAVLKRSDE